MSEFEEISQQVKSARENYVLILPHALKQMSVPSRYIAVDDLQHALNNFEVVEDYPDDARGHSCLLLGWRKDGTPVHIVCAPRQEYLAIITAYPPQKESWSDDFRKRR